MRGRTNVGGGDNLNFKIVGGMAQPGAGGDTLTWDGNTEGLVCVNEFFYKVSDATPTLDAFSDGCLVTFEGDTIPMPYEDIALMTDEVGCVCGEVFYVIPSDNFEASGTIFPEKGTYFMLGCTSLTIPGYTGFGGSAVPKENTIWVNTDTAITSWEFSATQPTGVEGMVWFPTSISSTVSFNALKKNNVTVYPITAKQYVSGAWVDKSAKTYQGGAWVDWRRYLYKTGDQMSNVTGGWTMVKDSNGTGAFNSDHIALGYTGSSSRNAAAYTVNKVDTSGFSTLKVKVNITSSGGADYYGFFFGVSTQKTNTKYEGLTAYTRSSTTGTQTLSLSLSSYQSSYYICLTTSNANVTVSEVWFE
jgi:hypothetical protein